MKAAATMARPVQLILSARSASDLMTPNPVSIDVDATIKEAIGFLVDRGFSAAPVIDGAGRPVGVVSQSDIVVHDREKSECVKGDPNYYERIDLEGASARGLKSGFSIVEVDRTRVRDIMTPVVMSVTAKAPANQVVEELLRLKVHRLFVVDKNGVLVGVISTVDILKHLRPE